MSYIIRDGEIKGINWSRFNALCRHGTEIGREEYWDNVAKEFSKFNATVDHDGVIEFESEEYFTWFVLTWS